MCSCCVWVGGILRRNVGRRRDAVRQAKVIQASDGELQIVITVLENLLYNLDVHIEKYAAELLQVS